MMLPFSYQRGIWGCTSRLMKTFKEPDFSVVFMWVLCVSPLLVIYYGCRSASLTSNLLKKLSCMTRKHQLN